jgi:hypothetical protein
VTWPPPDPDDPRRHDPRRHDPGRPTPAGQPGSHGSPQWPDQPWPGDAPTQPVQPAPAGRPWLVPAYGPPQEWAATAPAPRRGPQRLRARNLHNVPAIMVLAGAAGGLAAAVAIPEHWLRGVLFMAGSLILAGLFRLGLPARQAGILAVRGRLTDVLCYVGTGSALWLVGLLLPPART